MTAQRKPYTRHIADIAEIPAGLAELPIWCAWKLIPKPDKKPDKVPVSPVTRGSAWRKDKATFCTTAEQAINYADSRRDLHGIGFILYDDADHGLIGGDLDHCVDANGEPSSRAREIMQKADTYCELSPGLDGFRFIARGTFGGHTGNNSEEGVEFYEGGRFLTFTGHHLEDTPFAIEERDLTELGRKYRPAPETSQEGPESAPEGDRMSLHKLALLLACIPNKAQGQGYDEFQKVAAAISYETGESAEGFRLFNNWCKQSDKYDAEKTRITYYSFDHTGGKITTGKTLYFLAMDEMRKLETEQDLANLDAANDPLELQSAKVTDLLDSDPPPREWLVDQRIPKGVVGLLGAAGGTGKSMLVLQLGISVCTGLPWLEMPMGKPGSVLMFSAEDDREEVHRRLRTVLRIYSDDVDPFNADAFKPYKEAIAQRLYVFDRVGMENRLTAKVNGETQRTAFVTRVIETAQQVPDVALIVLDPLSRFDGGDPNDNADATRLIECAEQVRKATGATVLLPHHVNKGSLKDPASGQEAIRGGSGLVDGSRWVGLLAGLRADQAKKDYGIDPDEAGQYVRFTTPKANYSAPWEGTWLRRLAGGALVPCELQPVKDTRQEQKAEDRYEYFLVKAKEMIRKAVEKSDPLTATKLRAYSGTSGVFGMGDQLLRGCINRAIEEGDIIKGFDKTLRLG